MASSEYFYQELAKRYEKEIDIKDKRISLLEEANKRRQEDIETLKAEITRQNNIIVDYMNTNASLRDLADKQKKIIKAMATWIDKQEDSDKTISICANSKCPDYISLKEDKNLCETCIINYFESEVKE